MVGCTLWVFAQCANWLDQPPRIAIVLTGFDRVDDVIPTDLEFPEILN